MNFTRLLPFFAASLIVCLFASGQGIGPSPLPIKRVVLYKNGVGYFEHLGQVQASQKVTISFTSGQLNDVLKSLTVLDLNGGRISGVGYGTEMSMDRQLGDIPIDPDSGNSLTAFLARLRGARIEVRSGAGAAITGRLLSVERKTRANGGTTLEVDYIALLTDSGELRTTEVSPSFSVRLLEKNLAEQVGRFLDVYSQEREPDIRQMVIATEGDGQRNLFVSYISEVPMWKSTYRLVLDSAAGKAPLIQGWAIVDNTVGQDWENVELSLVAGAPQSFIHNLSRPVYTRRPVVEVEGAALSTPQTYESTLRMGKAVVAGRVTDSSGTVIPGAKVRAYDSSNQLVGETITNDAGNYQLGNLPDGEIRIEAESMGFRKAAYRNLMALASRTLRQDVELIVGEVAETVTVSVTAETPTLNTSSASLSRTRSGSGRAMGSGSALRGSGSALRGSGVGGGFLQAMASSTTAASAQDLGDLFEYKLPERLTINKNQSALVPIVQSGIQAEKVSIWNESGNSPKPMRGLWITNTTGLTLDGGSFGVLEEDAFAGEGIFEPIRPNEKRLVAYATDLALNVSSRIGTEQKRSTRVIIARGMMTHESEVRETKTYTFRNEDAKPRNIVVEHPVRAGFELRGSAEPDETTDQWMRFRLTVGARETKSLVVEEGKASPSTMMISNLDQGNFLLLLQNQMVTADMELALGSVLEQKKRLAELGAKVEELTEERSNIYDDQERLRENLKSLRGSSEEKDLTQRYVQQLNRQEDRLFALDAEIDAASKQADAAQQELSKLIEELSFDAKL